MGIIYKVENKINGKIYIGQTICSLEKRWNEHIRASKTTETNYALHRAIRKYGNDAFIISIVEDVADGMLNEREIYWIAYFDSYHNGYNCTIGGDGGTKADYGLIRKLWDKGMSKIDIASKTSYSVQTIFNALHDYENYSSDESRKRGKQNQSKRICQYDLNGNYIMTYDSITDAAKKYCVDRTLITACCKKKRPSGIGFQWRYEDDNPPHDFEFEQNVKRSVNQYSEDQSFIASYNSITDAAKAVGLSHSSISKCCSGKSKTSGGFIWKYAS